LRLHLLQFINEANIPIPVANFQVLGNKLKTYIIGFDFKISRLSKLLHRLRSNYRDIVA